MSKRKKRMLLCVLCMAAVIVCTCFTVIGSEPSQKVFSDDIFTTKDFVMEYATGIEENGSKGLLFTGHAPASFSLKEKVGGDFDMSFSAIADNAELWFEDEQNGFSVSFAKKGNKLEVSMEEERFDLSVDDTDVITVAAFADESRVTVSVEDNVAEFDVAEFDFTEYAVQYTVKEHSEGETGICVYSVNGTALNKPVIRTAEKRLYMPVLHDGVQGVSYELEKPILYDVLQGISGDVSVSVTKDRETVLKEQEWEKGLSFPTESEGEYIVCLTAGNLEKEYRINARKEISESSIHVKEKFPFEKVGTGSEITLPRVLLENDLYGDKLQQTQYVISLDGKRVDAAVGSGHREMFSFDQAGIYRFDYYSAESYLEDTYSFIVEVTGDLPAIIYEYRDESSQKGEAFTLPKAQMIVDGEELETKTVLHYPSGRAISNNTTLTEAGIYTVEFRAMQGERLYTYSYDYTVEEKLHQTENLAEYGSWEEGYFDEPVDGLVIELTNGSTYEFGNIIDLSDNTDPYATVMNFYILPYTKGQADFTGLEVKLTDAYDEDNYITVNFKHNTADYGMAYVTAHASNQEESIGLEWYNDTSIRIHKDDAYGYLGLLGFTGEENINYPAGYHKVAFNLCFDNTTQILYGTHGWHSSGAVGLSRVLTRLADTSLYKEAFKGFTTGEVRLSVRAYNFQSSKGRMLITNLDGQDLTQVTVKDATPPVITVDTNGYTEESIPVAVVGKEYPVFSGKAVDAQSGEQSLHVNVYYVGEYRNYNVSHKKNAFIPEREGTYLIEYTAQDFYRNTAVKQILVQAGKEIPIEAVLSGTVETAFTGEWVPTADYQCSGGSGRVELQALTVTDGKGQTCETENGRFQPQTAGQYTVSYEFKDYIGTEKQVEYTVEITDSKNPILNIDPVLPMAFLNGGTYELPNVSAQDYSAGKKQEVSAEIWVTDAEGKRKVEKGKYTASGENGTNATVSYVFKTTNGELTREYSVPVRKLSVGEEKDKLFNLAGLVVPTNGSVVTQEENDHYFVAAKQDERFFFANKLLADIFNFEFNIGYLSNGNVTGNQVEKVRITLSDSEDRSEQIYVDIEKSPESEQQSLLSLNGGTKYVIDGSFFKNTNYTFNLQYNGETKCISDSADLSVDVTNYADGKEFEGFSSGTVYCTVEMNGVTGNGVWMELIALNGQPLTNGDMKDRIAPSFALTSALKVSYSVGDTAQIPKALVSDVISTGSHVKLSVQTPSNEFAKAADGTKLEKVDAKAYEIKMEEIGTYLVTYTVWDDNGGTPDTVMRTLNVLDKEAPVITASKKSLSVKKGKMVNADIFEVSDNSGSEDIKIQLYVQNKKGKLTAVEGTEYKFDEAGKYRLIAVAYDAAGNIARKVVPVTVGGAK